MLNTIYLSVDCGSLLFLVIGTICVLVDQLSDGRGRDYLLGAMRCFAVVAALSPPLIGVDLYRNSFLLSDTITMILCAIGIGIVIAGYLRRSC